MKKRILALLVAVSLMVTNLPLSPIVSAQGSEGTTAVVGTILSVPTSGDNAASGTMEGTELHNTDGQSLAIRHEDGGSFLVIDEAVATKGNTATSVTAKFFADTMNAAGLPASVALTENAAIAIRVKFNDNSTAITYNPAAFKVNLAKTGAVSALANTTVDHTNTAKWLDLGDASLTKMYPTDYATDSAVGYQFMGNMDGYMIIPLKLFGDGFAAADIMASFEALEIVPVSTYANDATAATDGTKYSTYKNRELLIGDIVLVNDVNAFVTEKTEGMTKYASGLNDTAYSGQTIRGYRNHYSTDGAVVGSTNKLDVTQKDISNPTTNATGGYIHMAVLSGGERAIAVKANEGVNISVRNNITYSYTTIDTYEGRNTNNTITGTASGIPSTVIENNNAGKLSGFAVRIYVANNEGKTLYVHPFYSKAFGNKGYYTLKPGDYTFISAETGRAATLTYTAAVNTTDPTGIAITGNLNGWIIIPNYTNTYWNCGSSAYEGDSIGAGIVGYGAYINGLTDYNQTVYFGDTLVVKNSEQFLNVRECCIGTPHVFDNVCDKTCNECRYVRDANHTREFNCSTECLVCGAPIEPIGHNFDGLLDDTCNGCGLVVPKNIVNAAVVKPSSTTNNFVTLKETDIIENGATKGTIINMSTTDKTLLSELTDDGAIAIRIKFKDNPEKITFNPAAFKILLSAQGGSVEEENTLAANTTIDHENTAMWLDLDDASFTKMYPTDFKSDEAANYQFMGNMNGYMIIPIKLFGEKYTAAQIKDYFKYVALEPIVTEAADIPTDGTKYSSYEDRELSVGDVSFISDIDAFANDKTTDVKKYRNDLDDAYIAQAIRGYRNHYTPTSRWGNSNLDNVTTSINNPATYANSGYLHMAVLPSGERVIKVSAKSGADVANNKILYAYSQIDTYTGKNTDNTLANAVIGTEKSIISNNPVGDAMGIAMRIKVDGNEGKTLKIRPTPVFDGTFNTYYYINPGEYTFMDPSTGKMRKFTANDTSGIIIEGNVDGWLFIPSMKKPQWNGSVFSGLSEAKGGLVATLDGFGAYVNGLTANSDQTVYFGDVLYVNAAEQETFLNNRIGCKNNSHVFNNDCDTTCNDCYFTREASHLREFRCSETCQRCGAPIIPLGHTFDNIEDTTCNECGKDVNKNIIGATVAPSEDDKTQVTVKEEDVIKDGVSKGTYIKVTAANKNVLSELTDDGAVAIRIKFKDDPKTITFNPAAFKVLLSAQGGKLSEESSALANVTIDHENTAMWLDLDDASFTKMYPTDYESDEANGYQFMGNMNGYMIIPLKLFGEKYTAKQIQDYFKYVALELVVTDDADIPADGSKYSSYKDRELSVGEVVFVGDTEKFVEEKTAELVKYSTVYGDAYSGQMIRGYRNHFSITELGDYGETWLRLANASGGVTNAYDYDNKGYMHIAVIPGGERVVKVSARPGADIATTNNIVYTYTLMDTYDERNKDNNPANTVAGASFDVIASNMAGKTTGFAIRIYVTNNEGKTIKIRPFYSKKGDIDGYYTLKPGEYEFINNETGKINKLTNSLDKDGKVAGIEVTGNLNGWLIVSDFSNICWDAGANAYEGDNIASGLFGFGAYINNLSDYSQTVYLGDVLFIRNTDKEFFKTNRRTCEILGKHDYAPVVTVTPPTCEGNQKIQEACTRCGITRYVYSDSLNGHFWGDPIYMDATCDGEAYYLYECIRHGCNASRKEAIGAALGHGMHGSQTVIVPAAAHKGGYSFTACLDCGSAIGDHFDITAATCLETATKIVGVATADCTHEGYTGDTVCAACGYVYTYGKIVSKTAHKFAQTVATKATLSANGKITTKCSECGQIGADKAIYKIASVAFKKATTTYDGTVKEPAVVVKDSKGATISSSYYTVSYPSGMKNAGTYSVKVTFKGNYSGSKILTYTINPADVSTCTMSLSYTSYTYNGKVKTPAVTVKNSSGSTLKKDTDYTVTYASGRKLVGKYKVTVNMKGNYTGSKSLTFTVKPGKTKISSYTAYTKTIKVTVAKKTTQVTGYQIQYATNDKFTSAKTKTLTKNTTVTTKLTSLKSNKTYYVRVRTYKTVDGKRYYSDWSTAKKIKTKK